MSATWTSGTRQRVVEVCPGDLVTVRLSFTRDPGRTETPSFEGYSPHLVYEPHFAGRDGGPGTIGGDSPTVERPLEFRVDLDPFWCPYPGTLYLDGGGSDSGPITYTVTHAKTRCAPRPEKDPSFTLLDLSTTVVLPRGVYAASAPQTEVVRFEFNGSIKDLSLERQPTYLGLYAQGRVGVSPFGNSPVQILSFLVKL